MQSDLFGEPRARNTDPDTSHQAAERIRPLAGPDRLAVLTEHYKNPSGLTDFELANRLGRQQTSLGKRRGELRDAGYIQATDTRRPSPSGSPAIVWRITDFGKQALEQVSAGCSA